ncbi:hypothetical protein [Herbaspirillum seropedicae]|uniref:hypothetical protein n=1 Tax=Herbaspirillum seropedicae TaxID=964 RepID=UPI003D951D1E
MKERFIIVACAAAVFSSSTCKANQDILSANNQIALQYLSGNIDYTEKRDGKNDTVLDTERGTVPGGAITAVIMRDLWLGNDYLQFSYARKRGHTHYVGALMSGGNYGSVTASSGAVLTDYNLRLGKAFTLHPSLLLTPFADIGHHEWQRGVNAGETYRHGSYGVGLMLQAKVMSKMVVSATAILARTVDAHIDVANSDAAQASNAFSTSLGNSRLYKAALSIDYALTPALHASAGVDYYAFRYGRSANVRTANGLAYYEPKSDSRYVSFAVGVGYRFF